MKLSKAAWFGAIGAVFAELARRYIESPNYSKSGKNIEAWSCSEPGCGFSVGSSNAAVVQRDRSEHKEWHRRGAQ